MARSFSPGLRRSAGCLVALSAAIFGGPAVARTFLPASDLPASAPAAARDSWVLRGDQDSETRHGGTSQDCGKPPDGVADSDAAYVHNPDFGYARLPTGVPGRDSYAAYRASNRGRRKVVYVSTNDGMLHAFDADTGSERFTFVPTRLLGILPDPTSPSRTPPCTPSTESWTRAHR